MTGQLGRSLSVGQSWCGRGRWFLLCRVEVGDKAKKKKKNGATRAFRGDILGWNSMNWAMKDEEGTVGIALGGGQIKVWMSQGTHRAAQIRRC